MQRKVRQGDPATGLPAYLDSYRKRVGATGNEMLDKALAVIDAYYKK